jgi:hypothetical protein
MPKYVFDLVRLWKFLELAVAARFEETDRNALYVVETLTKKLSEK